jgi:hypothetical protein
MSTTYPNPCNSCGLCCMMTTCPVGNLVAGFAHGKPCPALEWPTPETSACGLLTTPAKHIPDPQKLAKWEALPPADLARLMGIGAGCCISARVIAAGEEIQFADLPGEIKTLLAQQRKAALT